MGFKKILIISILVLLLLAGMCFVIVERNNMDAKKSLNYFSQLIKKGQIGDISLTIYYLDPSALTLLPLSVDLLVNDYKEDVIYIEDLEEQLDLLKQISSEDLIPVEHESRIDARLYYVFKTKNNRKIFDVAMWGDDFSIYVNGLEVQENDIFYKIIIPFLPEDIAERLVIE